MSAGWSEEGRAWLAGLKPGDAVIESSNWSQRVAKVDRATNTQVIVGACRYRRSDGYRVGDTGHNRTSLEMPTQDRLDKIEARQIANRLSDVKWGELPLDVLRAVNAIVSAHARNTATEGQ